MSHCVIEHSSGIDAKMLMSSVYKGALESNLFEAEGSDIKVRSLPYSHYQTGSVDIDFVHVTLKILSGRVVEKKSMLSKLVLEQLQALSMTNCSLSVEVVDIDRASYAKVVL